MLKHHLEEGFLDPESCRALIALIDERPSIPAGVHREGTKYVDESMRRAGAGLLPEEPRTALERRWFSIGQQLAPTFGCSVTSIADTHTVHYRPGDFFAPHADQSQTVLPDGAIPRVLSLVVFLNDDFGGGILKLFEGNDCIAVPASAGTLVVFRSDVLHEVSPVAWGERYTLVSWLC